MHSRRIDSLLSQKVMSQVPRLGISSYKNIPLAKTSQSWQYYKWNNKRLSMTMAVFTSKFQTNAAASADQIPPWENPDFCRIPMTSVTEDNFNRWICPIISHPASLTMYQGDTWCLLVAKPQAGSEPKQATRILFRALHRAGSNDAGTKHWQALCTQTYSLHSLSSSRTRKPSWAAQALPQNLSSKSLL